jgi:hypothetical protein
MKKETIVVKLSNFPIKFLVQSKELKLKPTIKVKFSWGKKSMAHNGPARQSLGQQEDSLQQHQLIVEGSLLQLQGTVQGSVRHFCSLDYKIQTPN